MYILDTNVFMMLGLAYYPSRFATIWQRIDELVMKEELFSVSEVRREIEDNCPSEHVREWVEKNRHVFRKPNSEELRLVSDIFKHKQFLGFVTRQNILKGKPVADPFIVAAAKIHHGIVVTMERFKDGGARIPTACKMFGVRCIKLEEFLERENLP